MNGDAHASGPGGSQALPPAYTQGPAPLPPTTSEEHFPLPFYPVPITVSAAEELEAPGVPEAASEPEVELPTPEAFGYVAEPDQGPEMAWSTAIPEDAIYYPERATEGPPAVPGLEATAAEPAVASAGTPAVDELGLVQPGDLNAVPVPAGSTPSAEPAEEPWAVEPDAEDGAPAPAEPWTVKPAAEDAIAPGSPAEPWTVEPVAEDAVAPESPAEPWTVEPAAAADDATLELAGRLEALARSLREGGSVAATAYGGDSLDAALAGLISGYLAGRGR
jgi:hypothetical protein